MLEVFKVYQKDLNLIHALDRKTREETTELSKIPYTVLKIYLSCLKLCRSTCINRVVGFDTLFICLRRHPLKSVN